MSTVLPVEVKRRKKHKGSKRCEEELETAAVFPRHGSAFSSAFRSFKHTWLKNTDPLFMNLM